MKSRLIPLINERLDSIPVELNALRNEGIFIVRNGYSIRITPKHITNNNQDPTLIEFIDYSSTYNTDVIVVYSKHEYHGTRFKRDYDTVYNSIKSYYSPVLTLDLVPPITVKILQTLGISMLTRKVEYTITNQSIDLVTKLVIE